MTAAVAAMTQSMTDRSAINLIFDVSAMTSACKFHPCTHEVDGHINRPLANPWQQWAMSRSCETNALHFSLTSFPNERLTGLGQRIRQRERPGGLTLIGGLLVMMKSQTTAFKVVLALFCALALAACSKKNTANLEAGLGAGSGLSGSEAQVPGSAADFSTNVGDRVYFAMDQSNLSEEARDTLAKQAAWLQQYPEVAIQIEGHADERGTREYNISLSARRATAARNFLISQGISEERISSIAYGKERPAAFCDAEECWSQNRRAITVITSGARTS